MSQKISITVPSSQGEQTFYFGRKAVLLCTSAILSVPLLIGGALYLHYNGQQQLTASKQHASVQAQDAQKLIETLIVEKKQYGVYVR